MKKQLNKADLNKTFGGIKVKSSVKHACNKCKIIRRHGKIIIICENPKNKQKQG